MPKISLINEELPYGIEEELKNLRSNIQLSGNDKRVILFTSCLGGEGKSTTTLNLARSMAALGKNVLIIDTDLRKSVINQKVVSGKITVGLTHYLIGHSSAQDIIYETERKGVYIAPAGKIPPNPSELLSTDKFGQLITAARKIYDYIFIDCPPLGMVVDPAVIAQHCDGSILVIASAEISKHFAFDVIKKLKNTQCPIMGVVLNKVDLSVSKYYGRGKYHRYYAKEDEA